MSALTVAPRPLTRPAAARMPSGPAATRPEAEVRHVVRPHPVACRVVLDSPSWQLTRRGLVVVMALIAALTGSAVVTCLVAFLSVSNAPL
jgi:hypothetical protein